MHAPPFTGRPPSANDDFKSRNGTGLAVGVICAVAAHVVLFALFPTLHAAEAPMPVETIPIVQRPPAVDLPPPPVEVERPATPRVAAAVLDEGPFRFIPPAEGREDVLPPHRPGVRPDEAPAFIPRDREPTLVNRAALMRELQRRYPPMLREAGIEGVVRLFVYVTADGAAGKTELHRSSGLEPLDRIAREVIREARFDPASLDGEPVGVWILFPVGFRTR